MKNNIFLTFSLALVVEHGADRGRGEGVLLFTALLSPNLVNMLITSFGIAGISTLEEDI